ncbi:ferritin-like domain-containing protein [Sorangium sp. So ce1000]|uniref:ferritin-like domain-containing protein n=1 Tax=Sorangium sp. So ce1000 TaxID=3133325 RepID=UPI003F5D775B
MSMRLQQALQTLLDSAPLLRDASSSGNVRVLASLLGPAFRGFVQRRGKGVVSTDISVGYEASFNWSYGRDDPDMARLYHLAKTSQWNAATDLDWSRSVDWRDPAMPLLPDSWMPPSKLPVWRKLSERERSAQRHGLLSWMLSQFLHGEQGALFAASQITECVPSLDAKLYGSTQVADEGRHVEVFHAYLTQKLEKLYEINDNLYVVIDAIMSDGRWDMKFLGMQIMIEGLALGAFSSIRQMTSEPLLKDVLRSVITDEARHVHYGVLALGRFYREGIDERARREREDWAFELSVLLRNRFLAHEFYDEFYAHRMTRCAWDELMLESDLMGFFRRTMFRRIVPNLKRIGLLSARIRPRYASLGLLEYEHGRAASELTAKELLDDA